MIKATREVMYRLVPLCPAALLRVALSSFNFVRMMHDDRELHVSGFHLLFMGFLMADVLLVRAHKCFFVALKLDFVTSSSK